MAKAKHEIVITHSRKHKQIIVNVLIIVNAMIYCVNKRVLPLQYKSWVLWCNHLFFSFPPCCRSFRKKKNHKPCTYVVMSAMDIRMSCMYIIEKSDKVRFIESQK